MHLYTVLAVAAAGALGATSRYLLTIGLRHWMGESPWPVAAVNILGCFGFGVAWALVQGRMSHPIAIAVLAGFFGAFTTFSAFALDGYELINVRRYGTLVWNVLLQNGAGLLALWFGIVVGTTRDGA